MALALAALPGWAAPVEAEGSAAIDTGGVELARQVAIRDALRQASLAAGASVEGASVMKNGRLLESSRVRGVGQIANFSVINEWRDGDLLHVLIRAETGRAAGGCTGMSGADRWNYRKKIGVTRFHVANSLQVDDITDIWDGFPLELLRRLENTGRFLPINKSPSLAALQPAPPDTVANRELVAQLADRDGSQFVISGVILDAGYPFGQGTPDKRRLEVEIFVHDGLTGAVIARHRLGQSTAGQVIVGRDKPFASAAFLATDFGKIVDRTMNSLTNAIQADLDCLPFTARIVRTEGTRVFLDAGATSAIAPGDKLVVYARNRLRPVSELGSNEVDGVPERPVATVAIAQVQPLFAIGEVSGGGGKNPVQAGDLVRFESGGQE